ncbi:MAG TPA: hypothetical protein VMU29_08895 [Smithella sp.]|nr:hypothetical protein [Smithella sp.]
MAYEIFSIALLNKETGEIGLMPSLELLSKPRHIQITELESCLRMYEEELKDINNPEQRKITFAGGKGSDMNIRSGVVELTIVVIRKYIRNLIVNMQMHEFECKLQL